MLVKGATGDSEMPIKQQKNLYDHIWWYIYDDLSWDEHILQLCKNMNYYLHVLRRLNKIFPKQLLLNVYKSYIQSKLDYGLSIWGCTTEGNLDRVQRIQNFCARIICNNYDYINTRGIDLVKSLKIQAIRERRDYFLCVLMFKCIHGLAPHYLSNDVTMVVDIHGYDTRSSENMNLYVPRCTKELCKRRGGGGGGQFPCWPAIQRNISPHIPKAYIYLSAHTINYTHSDIDGTNIMIHAGIHPTIALSRLPSLDGSKLKLA